jgi:hypothetical protein
MVAEVYGPQKRYAEKQQGQGNVKISAWVPEGMRERALRYMAKLRKDHAAQQAD